MHERPAYVWFDLFRFLAASFVVFEHTRDMLWVPAQQGAGAGIFYKLVYFLTGFGHESVMVFFVLSGFWISSTVDRRMHGENFWGNYLVDRLARLVIVLLPALILGGVLDVLGRFWLHGSLYTGTSGAQTMLTDIAPRLSPYVFLGNAVFLQDLAVPTFGSNGPLWSLANEFWYYLWYPALLILFVKRRFSGLLASLVVAVLWPKLIPGFVIWLLGSVLYRLDRDRVGQERLGKTARVAIMAVLLLVSATALTVSRLGMLPEVGADLLVGLCFFGLFWSFLLLDPRVVPPLQPIAAYGSKASFSLYVSHFPLMAMLATLILHGNRLQPGAGALALLAGLIVMAWGYGWGFAQLTEARTQPVRHWLKARLAPARA